jgi:hypothetical protein
MTKQTINIVKKWRFAENLTAVNDMVVLGTSLDIVAEIAIDGASIERLFRTRTVEHERLSDGALEELLRAAAVRDEVLHALQTEIR